MKKKFVAAVLVLAMVMGMSTLAMAEETEEKDPNKGEAGIAYVEGEVEILDPEEPDVPGGDGWSFLTNRDIDFGEHDVVQNVTEQKYASWMEHRDAGTDYVGIVIRNGTLAPMSVSVEIEEFFVGSTETLAGFELELVKAGFIARDKDDGDDKANITNPNELTVTNPVAAIANSTNEDFDRTTDHKPGSLFAGSTATILALPGLGIHAASWGGILTVPQNTVEDLGEAQAVMTWSINNIPTDDDPDDDDI